MAISPFTSLACPLDGEPLYLQGSSWGCASGHSFDVARQGYTHLLPVQQKRSLEPGDSKAMVAARQRFLNKGHYQPLADAVSHWLLHEGAGSLPLACLDAGCGEGYYLRQLAAAAGSRELALVGVDISKWAVLAAAKQDRQPQWLVASNAHLPVSSASVDRVLCLFGFPVYPEFARVLKPGGQLLLVESGPDHLRQLREIIYPQVKPARDVARELAPGLAETTRTRVSFPLSLTDPEDIADLLAMTPHLYRANSEGRARASALSKLDLTIDINLVTINRV
ncbi:MAG: methyltransferase domain-containing protein [Halomonadaceae bacterium]|nr:MAG: methyltransferase domain-containing protein [Halomonadaceae bacterium]